MGFLIPQTLFTNVIIWLNEYLGTYRHDVTKVILDPDECCSDGEYENRTAPRPQLLLKLLFTI